MNGSLERGRREAFEGREMLEKRARAEREDASRTRGRLQASSSSGPRLPFVDFLNAMVTMDASQEMAGLDAVLHIRKMQAIGRRSPSAHNRAHDRFERAGGVEGFDRRYPGALARRSNFEVTSADPGNQEGSRFEQGERFAPELRAGRRVGDAAGSMSGDVGERWPSGRVEPITAEWLLSAALALITAVREQRANFPEGRRDQTGE